VIGETPQPAETPRNEGNPWSFADPDTSWWRGETERTATDPPTARGGRVARRRPAQHQAATGGTGGGTGTLLPPGESRRQRDGVAAEAHAAATRDVAEELHARAEPAVVERAHDRPDPHRYDPMRPPAGYIARRTAETVAADHDAADHDPADHHVVTADEIVFLPATPAEGPERPPAAEPDVMVLPEPNTRNRPTVPLAQRHHPVEPLPPATGEPATDARLERLENSPFWGTDPEAATAPLPTERAAHAVARTRSRRPTRRPVAPMFALVALALVSAFFAWVSAEPFWLAAGHGESGYATTTHCTGAGVTQRCEGRFAARDGGFTVTRVTLLGVGPSERPPGSVAPARMVSRDSHRAYLGASSPLLQLRWLLGFALVLLSGYTIAGVTGARRLDTGKARRGAVLASLGGPLLLLAGFLIAAY
jgi:hypothetical protein